MAKSTEEQLEDALAAALVLALELTGGNLERLSVSVQASGECPYKLDITDDLYGHVGLTTLPSDADLIGESATSVAESPIGESA